MAKASFPKVSDDKLTAMTQDEAEDLKQQVEAWAAAETAPLHKRMTEIDAEVAALHVEKRDLHAQIDEIEQRSADERYRLRGPGAGPDQVLFFPDSLSDAEIENLRRVVAQHDRRRG